MTIQTIAIEFDPAKDSQLIWDLAVALKRLQAESAQQRSKIAILNADLMRAEQRVEQLENQVFGEKR